MNIRRRQSSKEWHLNMKDNDCEYIFSLFKKDLFRASAVYLLHAAINDIRCEICEKLIKVRDHKQWKKLTTFNDFKKTHKERQGNND